MSYKYRFYPVFVFDWKTLIEFDPIDYKTSELLWKDLEKIWYSLFYYRGAYLVLKNY